MGGRSGAGRPTAALQLGWIGERRRAREVGNALARCGVAVHLQPLAQSMRPPMEVAALLVDVRAARNTPRRIAGCAPRWRALPFVVVVERFSLSIARTWLGVGACACVECDSPERLAGVLLSVCAGIHPANWALLQTVIDAVPAPIFFKDERGRYLGSNRAFEAISGVPPGDIAGKTVYDIAPPRLARVYAKADRALLAAGGTQLYEAQVRYGDGSVHEVMFHKAVYQRPDGQPGGIVGAILDITDRKRLEARLARLATLDPLTEALNRRSFMDMADRELSRARRARQPLSIMVIDGDRFKQVNDNHGHEAGDRVLQEIVGVARAVLRRHDLVARAGGEEFYVTLANADLGRAEAIAERLRRAIGRIAVDHLGHVVRMTASIGVTQCDVDRDSIESALRRADHAMYEAKRAGRNRVVSYPAGRRVRTTAGAPPAGRRTAKRRRTTDPG